jgi:orotate phosphoribosyltransferase
MTEFDPIKALREELAGLASVQAVITKRENAAEEAMGLAEVELNAIRKISGFVRIAIEERRAKLRQLEEAAEKSTS